MIQSLVEEFPRFETYMPAGDENHPNGPGRGGDRGRTQSRSSWWSKVAEGGRRRPSSKAAEGGPTSRWRPAGAAPTTASAFAGSRAQGNANFTICDDLRLQVTANGCFASVEAAGRGVSCRPCRRRSVRSLIAVSVPGTALSAADEPKTAIMVTLTGVDHGAAAFRIDSGR